MLGGKGIEETLVFGKSGFIIEEGKEISIRHYSIINAMSDGKLNMSLSLLHGLQYL